MSTPLEPVKIPDEIRAVRGCDCGGFRYHTVRCSLMQMPYDVATAAINEADDRVAAFTAGLNASLGLRRG